VLGRDCAAGEPLKCFRLDAPSSQRALLRWGAIVSLPSNMSYRISSSAGSTLCFVENLQFLCRYFGEDHTFSLYPNIAGNRCFSSGAALATSVSSQASALTAAVSRSWPGAWISTCGPDGAPDLAQRRLISGRESYCGDTLELVHSQLSKATIA
jgi:hypothetical protein